MSETRWSKEIERAFRAMEWADLNGDDLAGVLRLDEEGDAETLARVNDALLAAGDAFYALKILQTLAVEKP